MSFPLAKAVGVAVSVNRLTSAVGATFFVVAGIYQFFGQMRKRRNKS